MDVDRVGFVASWDVEIQKFFTSNNSSAPGLGRVTFEVYIAEYEQPAMIPC
jgi:hypothetical protein